MTDEGASEAPEITGDRFEPYGPMIALGFTVSAMSAAADRVKQGRSRRPGGRVRGHR